MRRSGWQYLMGVVLFLAPATRLHATCTEPGKARFRSPQ